MTIFKFLYKLSRGNHQINYVWSLAHFFLEHLKNPTKEKPIYQDFHFSWPFLMILRLFNSSLMTMMDWKQEKTGGDQISVLQLFLNPYNILIPPYFLNCYALTHKSQFKIRSNWFWPTWRLACEKSIFICMQSKKLRKGTHVEIQNYFQICLLCTPLEARGVAPIGATWGVH